MIAVMATSFESWLALSKVGIRRLCTCEAALEGAEAGPETSNIVETKSRAYTGAEPVAVADAARVQAG